MAPETTDTTGTTLQLHSEHLALDTEYVYFLCGCLPTYVRIDLWFILENKIYGKRILIDMVDYCQFTSVEVLGSFRISLKWVTMS